MSGLLRRLTRRRPATADENRSATAGSSEPAAAAADAPAEPGGDRPVPSDEQQTRILPATGEQEAPEQPSPGAAWAKSAPDEPAAPATAEQPTAAQPTAFAAQPAPVRDLPAGVDPGDLASGPADSARRGKLRRRLRYLRHVRELLLRDLGGFTYEVHRTAGGTLQETHRRLSEAKANRISAIDAEVGAIETRLGEPHAGTVLREAGIGGTCPECGELHASDARFCSRCGAPLDAKARAQREAAIAAAAAAPVTGSHETAEPQPASVLWAGGPRPSAKPEPEEAEPPAAVTSEWLMTRDQPTTFDRAAQPDEPAKADEAAATISAGEPGATAPADETGIVADEPAAADDAATTGEPAAARADEPKPAEDAATAGEQAAATPADDAGTAADVPKPVEGGDVAKADEPGAPADEPGAPADEPVASADEPMAKPDEPAAPADEPGAAANEPVAEEAPTAPAKPKRARRARKPAPKPAPEAADEPSKFEPGPNGRRDDDIPPPITSGDPLASRREQTP